ncbi:MAG: peptidylprolyl isomerase [Alphaproteobacteria bacterium]|nr:peptidylprolyl isomerase [Alphaproteobacteria bacterium]
MADFRTTAAALAGAGFIAAVSLLALTTEPPAAGAQTGTEATAEDIVVARVDGEAVYLRDLMVAYGQLPPQAQQMGMETIYPFLLDRVIDEKLLGIAAAKAIPPDDAEVKEQMDRLRERVTMQVYFSRQLDEKVTEERIREGYGQFLKDNPPTEELHARHILLETEEKAKAVLSEIQGGKDFGDAAKEHSTGPSGPNGGDLGYFAADAMVKPFSDAAFAMQAGQVSSAPVQTEFGWHLIKVEDRRETPQPAFEEMREQISQELSQTVAAEILDDLRGAATIEKFDLEGNPAPEEEPAPQ